jgi:hypothetical protein
LTTRGKWIAGVLAFVVLAVGGYIGFQPPQLRRIPISLPTSDGDISALEAVVHRLEEIHQSLQERLTAGERDQLEDERGTCEATLNSITYEAYGLSDEDRAMIEEFAAANPLVTEGDDV